MGKTPLSQAQVDHLRKATEGNELHSLLLNLGVDLMLRSSDLLALRVKDVISGGEIRDHVVSGQRKARKSSIHLPLSSNSKKVVREWLWGRDGEDFIFRGNKSAYTKKPITTQQYARIVKGWMADLPHKLMKGQDASEFSTHSLRKTKASIVYGRTRNIEAVRMILGHRSVTATSAYLGVTEKDATDLFRSIEV